MSHWCALWQPGVGEEVRTALVREGLQSPISTESGEACITTGREIREITCVRMQTKCKLQNVFIFY